MCHYWSENCLSFQGTCAHPQLLVGSCYSIFNFMCMFCKSLFVLLYFFILAVCSYSIYGFWLPPLVSSNSSFRSTSVLLVRYALLIFLAFCVVFLIYLPSSYVSCIPNVFSNVYFRFILTLMCFVLDSHCVYAIRISLRVAMSNNSHISYEVYVC
jgi:hypothetical protein